MAGFHTYRTRVYGMTSVRERTELGMATMRSRSGDSRRERVGGKKVGCSRRMLAHLMLMTEHAPAAGGVL